MKPLISLLPVKNPARQIGLAFLVALLLIATGFVLSFYSYSEHNANNDRAKEANRIINELEEVLSSFKDIEGGTRGFLMSGDSLYLESYFVATRKIPHQLDSLRAQVSNQTQRIRLQTLIKQAQAKLDIAELQIRSRNDRRTLLSVLLLGKLRMDELRRTVALMLAEEKKLMEMRNQEVRTSYQQTIVIVFLLSILTFLTLIVTYNLLDAELTQREKTEAQLRAYEEELQAHIRQLTTSNEELERFAFIASHDLQEPLRKIQSFAGLINERNKFALGDETNQFMSKIVHSADRMSRMIKDLLAFSRVSGQECVFQTVRLNEIVNRVLDDMELKIIGLDADVKVSPLPKLPVIPGQMEHVFANLIGNALKYQKPGQKPVIRISSRAISGTDMPELMPNKTYQEIRVTDNGIGFDPKYTEHIFQLFQRLHGKTTYDGTGIGLAVCRRIVLAHQGYITASSKPDEGATFVVILPEKQSLPDNERTKRRTAGTYLVG